MSINLKLRSKARYGWVRDLPDHRDLSYSVHRLALEAPVSLPPSADLTNTFPQAYDQGQLGSCTANAIAAAFEFDQIKQGIQQPWTPSRLFIYYNERAIEGTISSDNGAQIRDGIKVVSTIGVPAETEWSYDPTKFADKPAPDQIWTDAKKNDATNYFSIDNTDINQLKTSLAAGFPWVFGITVYSSFESQAVAANGIVPLPQSSEAVIGGHAIVGVGYDDSTGLFKFRNSWGTGWGVNGYGYLPYQYVTNPKLASDFWTIRSVICS
jgi:C1A family cysteine protease